MILSEDVSGEPEGIFDNIEIAILVAGCIGLFVIFDEGLRADGSDFLQEEVKIGEG
jgi:hypothetical protein